jgi:hypothetical protein
MIPDIVHQEASLHGNADAIIEDDGQTTYLHLQFRERVERQVRSVWVRNRERAPEAIDKAALSRGQLCMMPADRCRHPRGAPRLLVEAIRLVWLPESDGVALYERGTLLAAVMPHSGIEGFWGYATDAIGEGALASELSQNNLAHSRFRLASIFWDKFGKINGACKAVLSALVSCYEMHFGAHSRYYTVEDSWPPRGVLCIPWRDKILLLTVGVCIRPQPTLDLHFSDPRPFRRIELGVILPKSVAPDVITRAISTLCGLSSYPWRYLTWLGHGHSLPCDITGSGAHQLILFADSTRWGPSAELPRHDDDSVQLLWAVPVRPDQLELVRQRGADSVLASIAANLQGT